MKIRNGFVSNSSSSSFIVLLPDDYKLKETKESIAEAFEMLLADKELWANEVDYEDFDELTNLLKDYIIADIDSGPDEEKVILANKNKVKEIMEK